MLLVDLDKLNEAESVLDYNLGIGEWDVIVSIWSHLPQVLRHDVLKRCVQGLKPGGFLMIESFIPRQLEFKTGGPTDIEMLPTLAETCGALSELKEIVGREVDRDVWEGAGHRGKSAVMQYIGRRGQ